MNEIPPKLSFWNRVGNIVIGILFVIIGIPMAYTLHGARSSIFGIISIEGSQALIAGIGFCIWGLIMLIYTLRRILRERNTA